MEVEQTISKFNVKKEIYNYYLPKKGLMVTRFYSKKLEELIIREKNIVFYRGVVDALKYVINNTPELFEGYWIGTELVLVSKLDNPNYKLNNYLVYLSSNLSSALTLFLKSIMHLEADVLIFTEDWQGVVDYILYTYCFTEKVKVKDTELKRIYDEGVIILKNSDGTLTETTGLGVC